jgi:hypothetical protein
MAKARSTAGETRNAYRILMGLDVGGISDKQEGVVWTGFIWPKMGTSEGLL